MPKDQFAVLVNAQRFLLSLNKQNPWEGEISYFKNKNRELNMELKQLRDQIEYIQDQRVKTILTLERRAERDGVFAKADPDAQPHY